MKTNDQELETVRCAAIGLPKIATTPVHCGLADSKDLKTIRANLFQSIPMDVTVSAAARLSNPAFASPHIEAWLAGCHVDAPVSSNIGANDLPFQRWMKFKEAFSPTFVINALASLPEVPTSCVDPFGGSGTTALACSFLGIEVTTIEVNPFLADLIEAKITPIRASSLASAYAQVLDVSRGTRVNAKKVLASAPKSLREPGVNGRFVFWAEAIDRILALRSAIESVESPKNRRLLTVLLGSILVKASNVVVNGKGRRYRGGWMSRRIGRDEVDELFEQAVRRAAADLARFGARRRAPSSVLHGDSRILLGGIAQTDVAVFSPPYPNSFDYTDVYNLELWVLGYLDSSESNRTLRLSTLRSHVQVRWDELARALKSSTLKLTLTKLARKRDQLWDSNICEMIAGYFADMKTIFESLATVLRPAGHAIVVVGDSCYASVQVPTAKILQEVAMDSGFVVVSDTPIRSMRNSAQHGGRHELDERCLVLRRE